MENQTQIRKLRRLVWIGGIISLLAIGAALFASLLLYRETIDLLTNTLRERLLSISITEAANINAEALQDLHVKDDWKKPEWGEVVNPLKRAKLTNENIVYMYIFRKRADDPSKMEFVADADSIDPFANTDDNPNNNVDVNRDGTIDPEGADKLQWPGQHYDEAVDIPEAYEAYKGPITVKNLYTDSYGSVLTGYAPITNASGTVVAILATDIKADDFLTETRQTLYPFLTFITFLIVIISVLALLLIFLWQRRAESLTELDRLKSEFLSIATHQLRAPITALRGYASNMIDGTYGPIPEYLVEPLMIIQESGRLMTNSIEDYLNISRIEQGRMKFDKSTFDIVKLVAQVVSELQIVARQKNLTLGVNEFEPTTIYADVGKTKQVITNIIDNALKYTQVGSVHVSYKKSPNAIRIIVSDTGMGIAKEDITKLFSKFIRARDANKVNTTGTGLGLYVAKELTEGNGGKVWAESDGAGKGSRFIVELPTV